MKTNKYEVTELALRYFPESTGRNARRRFNKVLHSERALWQQLQDMNYTDRTRVFTPRQYTLVIDTLGAPDENQPERPASDFGGWG